MLDLDRLRFYFRNATLSLLRECRRAIFAVFTVVVGVGAIVGLQIAADILERSLTSSVRTLLRGDHNTAVVIVTHDPRISERTDRVLVMTDGLLADSAA